MIAATLQVLVETIWFLAPAGAANVAPIFASRLFPAYAWPVDFGYSVRGRRLFGSHKTWRGMIAGAAAAAAIFAGQQVLYDDFDGVRRYSQLAYRDYSWLFGAWIGTAALVGDLIKSAVKRQCDIAPGRAWVPFDQVDWLLGTIIFVLPFVSLSAAFILQILVVGAGLHLITHYVGYLLRLNATGV